MRKITLSFTAVFLLAGLILLSMGKAGMTVEPEANVGELKKQIEKLQKRVEELESSLNQQQSNNSKGFDNPAPVNRWDPFAEMERIQEEMNLMFQDSFSRRGGLGKGMSSGVTAFDYDLDLKEDGKNYVITLNMKGLDKEKVDVEINENSVTVKGEYSREEKEEGPNRYFSSRGYGSFLKTIPLPVDADTSKMKSEEKEDSLVITIPKK